MNLLKLKIHKTNNFIKLVKHVKKIRISVNLNKYARGLPNNENTPIATSINKKNKNKKSNEVVLSNFP